MGESKKTAERKSDVDKKFSDQKAPARSGARGLSRASSIGSSKMDILSAQQDIVLQQQVNKEESRRLNHLAIQLEKDRKVVAQNKLALEKDKDAFYREKKGAEALKVELQKKETAVEEQRAKNENERSFLTKWNRDLDTREEIVALKERKVLKRQQEVEEMKKNEMLIVHKQRQQDMDAVKEENDKQKSALLKEIEERRDLERAIIVREREALEQEKAQFYRTKELKDEGVRSKEQQLKELESSLSHERRQLTLEREKTEMVKHNTEVLKTQVDLESLQVEQNAKLAERRLEEKRQIHVQISEDRKKKLNNEISKKQFEVEQKRNKYEKHIQTKESEVEFTRRTKEKRLGDKEKKVDLKAEQNAKLLKAQQKSWESTQFDLIKSLSTSIVN